MSSMNIPNNSVELRAVSTAAQSNMDLVRMDRPSPRLSSFVPRLGKRFRAPIISSTGYSLNEPQHCLNGWLQDTDEPCPIRSRSQPVLAHDIDSQLGSVGGGLMSSRLVEMNLLGALEELLQRNRRAEEIRRNVMPRSQRIAFTPRIG